jgi:hypothetical protein
LSWPSGFSHQFLAIQVLAIRFLLLAGMMLVSQGTAHRISLSYDLLDFRVQMDESGFIQSHKLAWPLNLKHRNAQE